MIAELLRAIETENAKRKRKTASVVKKEREIKKQLNEEVKKELVVVSKEKKKQKQTPAPSKPKTVLRIGDRVRMFDGRSVGSIDAIEKKKAIVNYGMFTTQVNLDLLELVEAAKGKK